MNGRCDICGQPDLIQPRPNHFREVCLRHSALASAFILPLRFENVVPHVVTHRNNQMQCEICGQQLSLDERSGISPNHFIRTCYRHREFGSRFDAFNLRRQFAAGQLVSKYDVELRTQLLTTALLIYATN